MPSALHRRARILLLLCACRSTAAQVAAQTTTDSSPNPAHIEQVPKVPGVATAFRGLNIGVNLAVAHDSSIGWYSIATPAVSYTFTPHFSADASIGIYPYRLVEVLQATTPPSEKLVGSQGKTSDTEIGFHAAFVARLLRNTTTAYITAPTGDKSTGLGAGKATFDFSDHVDRYLGKTTVLVDIGAGNSSNLFNNLVTRNYSSVGGLAHFQAGLALWLPWQSYIQSVGYEQLPFGSQTVYTATGRPGAPNQPQVATTFATEDNGVTTSVGIPLSSHLTLSGYYNRSLRLHDDTVSIGITYVLRGGYGPRRMSMIDRALREAEGAAQ